MKRITRLLLVFFILAFTGCVEEQSFDFALPVDIEPQFTILEQDGLWSEMTLITYDDIADAVDDLEDDIVFDDISIEGISLIIDNQADGLSGIQNANLTLVDPQNRAFPVYQDVSISINPGQGRTEIVVTDLAREGVEALKDLLEGYVLANSFENFTIVSSGESVPAGTPLSMELTVILHTSLNYNQNFEVPYFMGNE